MKNAQVAIFEFDQATERLFSRALFAAGHRVPVSVQGFVRAEPVVKRGVIRDVDIIIFHGNISDVPDKAWGLAAEIKRLYPKIVLIGVTGGVPGEETRCCNAVFEIDGTQKVFSSVVTYINNLPDKT